MNKAEHSGFEKVFYDQMASKKNGTTLQLSTRKQALLFWDPLSIWKVHN